MSDYTQELLDWRSNAEKTLRGEESWLAVSDLFWLEAGAHSFGGDARCDLHLPGGPAWAGTLTRHDDTVLAYMSPGVNATLNHEPFSAGVLRKDDEATPGRLRFGSFALLLLRRGQRLGIRVWNAQAANRLNFSGRVWYAPNPALAVRAKFVADPKPIKIVEVTGDVIEAVSPGRVEFALNGHTHMLSVESADVRKGLFLNFKDATSGHGTYGAGRFLFTAGVADDDSVIIDFNRAVSPPCAVTDYATCPLPRKENVLSVPVEAGEKFAGH